MDDYNPILDTDSYKLSHFAGYPPEVTNIYSYAESRGGEYADSLFFGLQPFIWRLSGSRVTNDHIKEAEAFAAAHGEPFNRKGWERIIKKHRGYLPLRIRAVAEGSLIPTHNVLCTVENTDPELPWLTSYVETALLRQVWYATTVATRIFGMKKAIAGEFGKTADDGHLNPALAFALLDFSSRGCSSYQANQIGGAAYLAHFLGSDSVPAVRFVDHYYGSESGMAGYSVPATEHSITTAWGEAREPERMKRMIDVYGGPGKIISDVGDTWDVFRAAGYWCEIADYVKNSGTTLVFRPDSGQMHEVIPPLLNTFEKGFGTRLNSVGYNVLNGVKLLWGDGINEHTATRPFEIARTLGISAESIMVGSGGGLMQRNIDRDTMKFAFKASALSTDKGATWQGIAKDPVTDPGKRSKRGRLSLYRDWSGVSDRGVYSTLPEGSNDLNRDLLRTVYENGLLYNTDTIDVIRQRINSHL